MTDNNDTYPQLLPIGLSDLLSPEAMREEQLLRKVADYFTSCGYERVKPPLLEFEDSHASERCFRVMDPLSQDSRLMAIRSDMTVQVARIATERLKRMPRPLRLFYSGEVLRVKGSQLRPRRQFRQIGAEIIGTKKTELPTVEILVMAAMALQKSIGRQKVSFDLSLPLLVGELLASASAEVREDLNSALQVRDSDYLRRHKFTHAKLLADLAASSGDYAVAIRTLDKVKWTAGSLPLYKRLKAIAGAVKKQLPDIRLTVDIVENMGFDYQSGLSFTIYAEGLKSVLGRGGEYPAGRGGEPACGVSFYMDSLLQIAPQLKPSGKRILAAKGTSSSVLEKYRKGADVAVADLQAKTADALQKQAKLHGYSHILINGKIYKTKD